MTNSMARNSGSESQVAENDSFILLLADICRRHPALHDWLLKDFARSPAIQANFLSLIANKELHNSDRLDGFAELADEGHSWAEEKKRLRAQFSPNLFGGLTWKQMEKLVNLCEARTISVEVFLLARDWQRLGDKAKHTPRMLRRGADFLEGAIRAGNQRSLQQLGNAVDCLAAAKKSRSQAFGFGDWWRLHALLYMLQHPRPAYRTRDVRSHLASLGLKISSLDFRRFCNRHGIRRDERAGRPRGRREASAHPSKN